MTRSSLWLVAAAVAGIVAAATGTTGLGVVLVLVVLAGTVVAVVDGAVPPDRRALDVADPTPTPLDEIVLADADRGLDALLASPAGLEGRLREEIADLARQRLATRHGVDADRDPDRVRDLLGPDGADLLRPGPAPRLDRTRLTDLVTRLERL